MKEIFAGKVLRFSILDTENIAYDKRIHNGYLKGYWYNICWKTFKEAKDPNYDIVAAGPSKTEDKEFRISDVNLFILEPQKYQKYLKIPHLIADKIMLSDKDMSKDLIIGSACLSWWL